MALAHVASAYTDRSLVQFRPLGNDHGRIGPDTRVARFSRIHCRPHWRRKTTDRFYRTVPGALRRVRDLPGCHRALSAARHRIPANDAAGLVPGERVPRRAFHGPRSRQLRRRLAGHCRALSVAGRVPAPRRPALGLVGAGGQRRHGLRQLLVVPGLRLSRHLARGGHAGPFALFSARPGPLAATHRKNRRRLASPVAIKRRYTLGVARRPGPGLPADGRVGNDRRRLDHPGDRHDQRVRRHRSGVHGPEPRATRLDQSPPRPADRARSGRLWWRRRHRRPAHGGLRLVRPALAIALAGAGPGRILRLGGRDFRASGDRLYGRRTPDAGRGRRTAVRARAGAARPAMHQSA